MQDSNLRDAYADYRFRDGCLTGLGQSSLRGGRADRTRAGTPCPGPRGSNPVPCHSASPPRGRADTPLLPVEGSNLGLRSQNPVSVPTGPTGIVGAPGPGLEPGLTTSKAAVLPDYTNRDQCPYQDSNLDRTDSESAASTNWATRAFNTHVRLRGVEPRHGLALDQPPLPVGLQPHFPRIVQRRQKESRPDRFPDGRLLVMTTATSRRGA